MRLRFTSEALDHLSAIHEFLSERNAAAARHVIANIRAAAERLLTFPGIGRPAEAATARVWVVRGTPYLIVYEVRPEHDEVVVIGVFHGAQDWPDRLP